MQCFGFVGPSIIGALDSEGMQYEQVYERILSRVAPQELNEKCRDVAQREAKGIERRIRGAQRALQHAYDVEAARQRLPPAIGNTASTAALLKDIAKLQSKIASRMQCIATSVSRQPLTSDGEVELASKRAKAKAAPEPAPEAEARDVLVETASTPTKRNRLKRRLSRESVDSPRKPPRPGRLAIFEQEEGQQEDVHQGPHARATSPEDEATEEEDVPMELAVLDSDTEFEAAAYLEKARHLRKISSERRMGELPGLIKAVLTEIQRHEWTSMPRELLGTLSATLGAATTLKPAQRKELHAELARLRAVATLIDETKARQYPTLLGSTASFLSSLCEAPGDLAYVEPLAEDDTTDVTSTTIQELHDATSKLAKRVHDADELKSMEQIDEILRLVDHVFDNPTLARSQRNSSMVTASLDTLIKYVIAIPRNTRRKLQCEDLLRRRRAQVTGLEV